MQTLKNPLIKNNGERWNNLSSSTVFVTFRRHSRGLKKVWSDDDDNWDIRYQSCGIEKRDKKSANHFYPKMKLTKREKGQEMSESKVYDDFHMISFSPLTQTTWTTASRVHSFFFLFKWEKSIFSPSWIRLSGDKTVELFLFQPPTHHHKSSALSSLYRLFTLLKGFLIKRWKSLNLFFSLNAN